MVRKINAYKKILLDFLKEEADSRHIEGIEFQVIADEKNNHYQLVEVGWYEKRFLHHVLYHFDIKPTGKVWLMLNNTDTLVAEELVKRGIPAMAIVLGFQPAYARPLTGYAVA